MLRFLGRWLAHPLTRDLPVDSPETTVLRRRIVREKVFLAAIYREWYGRLIGSMRPGGRVLEIGSGGGFLKDVMPGVIASEVFLVPGVDVVADGCRLPFSASSLDGIVMTDVFHHIPDVAAFLGEAARCVRAEGRLAMIEPWRTPWSQWVYRNLHPEPFEPDADWRIPRTGPLSGANGALPWIVFCRDRERLSAEFPAWRLTRVVPLMPMAYLLSGGVSLRLSLPGWLYPAWRALEERFNPGRWAMFAFIELERRP
jgi:SAM-dependent methyltransferase